MVDDQRRIMRRCICEKAIGICWKIFIIVCQDMITLGIYPAINFVNMLDILIFMIFTFSY